MQEPGQEFGYIHFNFVVYAGLCWVLLLIWSDGFNDICDYHTGLEKE
jgi:hypothetical protein